MGFFPRSEPCSLWNWLWSHSGRWTWIWGLKFRVQWYLPFESYEVVHKQVDKERIIDMTEADNFKWTLSWCLKNTTVYTWSGEWLHLSVTQMLQVPLSVIGDKSDLSASVSISPILPQRPLSSTRQSCTTTNFCLRVSFTHVWINALKKINALRE